LLGFLLGEEFDERSQWLDGIVALIAVEKSLDVGDLWDQASPLVH
jgi:hypothetical protein